MTDRQNDALQLIQLHELTYTWVAKKLGLSKQTLGYQLNKADEMDYEIYLKIKNLMNQLDEMDSTGYIPIHEAEQNQITQNVQYKIMGIVPAGVADLQQYDDWQESEDLWYDPREHFYLRVDPEFGYSMLPLVNPGDLVLVSTRAKVNAGDIVAAKWDDGKGALKILSINPDIPNFYGLMSYNPVVPPLLVEKSKASLYKVVLIKKRK